MLVQTPHVHTNLNSLAVLVQPYDEHGNSRISSASMAITVSLTGASSLSLSTYSLRGPSGESMTRRYSITVPSSWFSVADVAGSTATVTTTLSGYDSHLASLVVYGTPASFSSTLSGAGIAAFFTSDTAGSTPAQTMRAGDSFYLQLYAHTGGLGLTSFEVKIVENSTVCQLVPTSGSYSLTYTGGVQGDLSGTYQTELLNRLASPGSEPHFTKYSRFQKLSPLTATHGHLGYIQMTMVGSGECLLSAVITTFFHSGTTAYIPGVANNDPVSVHGNQLALYVDAPVGVFGQLTANAPIVNTAAFTGASVSVGMRALLFSSPDSLSSSTATTISVGSGQNGSTVATVSANAHTHNISFAVVRPDAPVLLVDDATLNVLPGSCGSYQRTRLRAMSAGVDISRLLTFSSTDTNVLTVDASISGHPSVVGVGVGTASIYVQQVSYASVSVTVSATQVAVTSLDAGIVSGVRWISSPSVAAGPYEPFASHEFTSESSEGWLYVIATFDDGALTPAHSLTRPMHS